MARISWLDYFFELVQVNAARSSCLRRQVGAVAVDPTSKRVLAQGYNGAPAKIEECLQRGCYRESRGIPSGHREELCFAVHAEQNLLAYAARFGVSLDKSWVFVSCKPCLTCLKLLYSAGIKLIVYQDDYPTEEFIYQQIAHRLPLISRAQAEAISLFENYGREELCELLFSGRNVVEKTR